MEVLEPSPVHRVSRVRFRFYFSSMIKYALNSCYDCCKSVCSYRGPGCEPSRCLRGRASCSHPRAWRHRPDSWESTSSGCERPACSRSGSLHPEFLRDLSDHPVQDHLQTPTNISWVFTTTVAHLLGPFHGAIAVPSVTRCRCRRH